ncbi:endonuclease MutS2 [Oxobacter pfennigii]|uniref:Endonuclease MutS2 n=1 Tax=Oxobacter pfennigii TaxID=36849 RepID=A0A0P8YH06_9CLOT|nr:endonuclease MutS2 [Oxobacter pfennigii]KPU46379.1 endonuclease MutS2 [Oxobacter pfennigii]
MNQRTLRVLEFNKIIDMLSDRALSSMGSEIAKNLIPSSHMKEVKIMQEETDEAVSIILRKGSAPLEGLNDIRPALKRVSIGSVLDPGELLKISDHLRCARRIKGYMDDNKENYPIIKDYIEGLTSIKSLEDEISNCIISEEEVSDRASTTLYNIRRQIKEKNSAIRDKLSSIIRSSEYSKALQDAIITVRGDRFVVPVKSEHRGSFQGLVHDQSSSGSTLFIEPMAVVEMNNAIKELKAKERAEIERILSELTQKVEENLDNISVNNDILSQLDFIFAKAKLAIDLKCMPPSINDEGYINLKNSRHPLIDPDVVVPNNIIVGKEFSELIITGPNTGGKTVTLKTAGLLTLMAAAGLQIPASENSTVAVFDQVFADIGDEQSIEQSLSTFSSHMTNIVGIMAEATSNSLCLFDELGAGTDPTEGAALAMAILDELYERGAKVIATTHYSELKIYALQREGVENASVEFDVETLRPTYKLLIGIPGKSNAFEISKRLGLSDYIIQKARNLISKDSLEFEELITSLQKNSIIANKEREEAERLKAEIKKIREEYENRREKLEKARDAVISEARREARNIIKDAKDEADALIKEIRQAAQEAEADRNRQIEEARKKLKGRLDEADEKLSKSAVSDSRLKPLKDVKPGDTVFIETLNQNGTALTSPDIKGEVSVQVGIMKINVHISNLKRKEDTKQKAQSYTTAGALSGRTNVITSSIDLRGQTLDEALINVDKYLDDAYLSSLSEVTIIHGKGTGVLRQGIMDMLKHHSHIKSYRPGNYGEGGIGVTVVEIKR